MRRLAIYPGSFNPFTVGHQNILEKAECLFDEVVVAVGVNVDKINYNEDISDEEFKLILESTKDSRVKVLSQQLQSKRVEGYIGFLTEYVREKSKEGYDEIVIIRGLRNGYDYDYEYNQMRHMWDQMPQLNIIMISCDPIFSHVSSSSYRALERIKSASGHHLLAIDRINPRFTNRPIEDGDEDIRL